MRKKWEKALKGKGGLEAFLLIEDPKRWEGKSTEETNKIKKVLWDFWSELNPDSDLGGKKPKKPAKTSGGFYEKSSEKRFKEIVDILGGEVIE